MWLRMLSEGYSETLLAPGCIEKNWPLMPKTGRESSASFPQPANRSNVCDMFVVHFALCWTAPAF